MRQPSLWAEDVEAGPEVQPETTSASNAERKVTGPTSAESKAEAETEAGEEEIAVTEATLTWTPEGGT